LWAGGTREGVHRQRERERERERDQSLWELRGSAVGPRGEILTPATMGGEQKRVTVRGIMDRDGREREMGLNEEEGVWRGEVKRISTYGMGRGQSERREGDNTHIQTHTHTYKPFLSYSRSHSSTGFSSRLNTWGIQVSTVT
jgi:hypothetical protein